MRTESGGEGGNGIAVVAGAQWAKEHQAEQNLPPSAALGRGVGECERGFTRGLTEDRGAGNQVAVQGGQFRALVLTEPALQPDAEVAGLGGRLVRRAWNL